MSTNLSRTERAQEELHRLLEQEFEYRRTHQLECYKPYPKQLEFHNCKKREILFQAGNQLGKTIAGSMQWAMHLTGQYFDGYSGRRFTTPVTLWAAGESGESTRDSIQKLLLGPPGDFGTGSIPKESIVDYKMARGVPDLVDYVVVQHGKVRKHDKSYLYLKSYGKGRERWQAVTIHGVWFDEEPDPDVYSEGVTRTNKHMGPVIITFTPLKGMSDVVSRFLLPAANDKGAQHREVVKMGINDVPDAPLGHYTKDQKEQIINSYSEHERNARAFGEPFLGSGKVFNIPEEEIRCSPFEIPPHFRRLGGLDFGWGDHPTAGAFIAYDSEADIIYLYDGYRSKETGIATHASALRNRSRGKIRFSWPHDGLQKDKSSGVQIAQIYRNEGLDLISEHAQFPGERGMGLEAGIFEMEGRFKTGRLKVFSTVEPFFEEYRGFHRLDGQIVKVRDDLISALRYAIMMLRYAEPFEEREKPPERYAKDTHRKRSWMSM